MSARLPTAGIAASPDQARWGDDDLLTVAEVAMLTWPDGPLIATRSATMSTTN